MVASNEAQLRPSTDARAERYRHAERRFWGHYGLAPVERFVEVGSPPVRLRVQELGSGEPVLFVNGTGSPGAYFAPLLRGLHRFRCLVLDRPGWGLSAPVDYSAASYRTLTAELLRAPLTSETGVPRFIRLLRSPLGRIITRVPENRRMLGKQLAALGHTAGSGPGQIPEAFVDWHLAMSRETDWARHEREMVRRVVGRRGYVADLVLTDDEIASIEQPTLLVYGTADPIGSLDVCDGSPAASRGASWRSWTEVVPWSGTTTPSASATA